MKQQTLMVRSFFHSLLPLASIFMLFGCPNPYALNLNKLDLDAEQKYGIIQFSDPKTFPREYLINERREELSFLETALKKCSNVDVEPEIIRELEVIRSIAASAGVQFDPAAAFEFKSAKERAEIENEIALTEDKIALLKTEMQLAQVQRDLELFKEQLEKQETVSKPPDPSNGQTTPTTVTGKVQPPTKAEIEALNAEMKNLATALKAKAQSPVAALQKKGGTAHPIDAFNYKRACRDTVKSAINQTKLDELHDADGNTLIRLQLRATTLPGKRKYNDTLGILRMEIVPPNHDDEQSSMIQLVYRNWIDYVNRSINLPPLEPDLKKQRIRTAPQYLSLSNLFDLRLLEIPKYEANGDYISDSAENCSGLRTSERMPDDCWYPRIALPLYSIDPADKLDIQIQNPSILSDMLNGAAETIRTGKDVKQYDLGKGCSVNALDDKVLLPRLIHKNRAGLTARAAVNLSFQVKVFWSFVASLPALLQDFEPTRGAESIALSIQRFSESLVSNQIILKKAADNLLSALNEKNPNCPIDFSEQPVPKYFTETLNRSRQRVAVYDVAPVERIQAVSTAARMADAIAMAASVAGTLPSYGIGASGNFAFSRSAIGKADALELAPIVVGFMEPMHTTEAKPARKDKPAEAAEERFPSFGWLLGPQATLDPKNKKLTFAHPVKPNELYADLSLPGWWPEFSLKTHTAWAPNWRDADNKGRTADILNERLERTIKVSMRHNSGDMTGLTSLLLKAANLPSLDAPKIIRVDPPKISPCDQIIDFQIWGDNVWRTSMVHIGGKAIHGVRTITDETKGEKDESKENPSSDIKLLPDMRGIVVSIDISELPIRRKGHLDLTVWTPDGRDSTKILFLERLKSDGSGCEQLPKKP